MTNQKCMFCEYFITVNNHYSFCKIKAEELKDIINFYHDDKNEDDLSIEYKDKLLNPVFELIQNEQNEIDPNRREEIIKRRNLSLQYISKLNYDEDFDINLNEDYETKKENLMKNQKKKEKEQNEIE